MTPKLTIGIITCGRNNKIKECLFSIRDNVKVNHKILVVDSLINNENIELYDSFSNLEYISFSSPISPSHGRKMLSKYLETSYLLYLDDDLVVREDTVEKMLDHAENRKDVGIVGGIWEEYGKYRPVGHRFIYGKNNKGEPLIFKFNVLIEEIQKLKLSSLKVDSVQASILIRQEVLDQIQFDEEYTFFYELWDFYMQAANNNVSIEVLLDACFDHKPTKYLKKTKRQNSQDEEDKNRFMKKWNVKPEKIVKRQTKKEYSLIRKLIRKLFKK